MRGWIVNVSCRLSSVDALAFFLCPIGLMALSWDVGPSLGCLWWMIFIKVFTDEKFFPVYDQDAVDLS